MARYNEILVGRFNRLAQKLLSMKGPAAVVTLSDEMHFAVPQFHGAENRYLESWNRFSYANQVAAAASNQSGARLRNPTGSNVIAVIEEIFVGNENAALSTIAVTQGAATTDLAVLPSPVPGSLDPRGQLSDGLILSVQNSTVTIAGLATLVGRVPLVANGGNQHLIYTQNQEIPILPGQAIQLVNVIVNQQITYGMIWRERFLEDSERT